MTRLEMAAGFLVAWSWARLLVSGHPSPDLGALPFPLDLVGAAGFVAVVLVCLRAHLGRVAQAAGDATGWRGLTREALVLALLAGIMLPFLSGDLFSALAYAELVVKPSVDPFTLPAPGTGGVERPAVPQPPLAGGALRLRPAAAPLLVARRPVRRQPPDGARGGEAAGGGGGGGDSRPVAPLLLDARRPGPHGLRRGRAQPGAVGRGGGPGPRRRPGGSPLRRLAPGGPPTRGRARLRPPRGRRRLEADRRAARRDVPRLSRGPAGPVAGARRARRRGHERARARRRARVLALLERPRHAARAARVPGRAQADQQRSRRSPSSR